MPPDADVEQWTRGPGLNIPKRTPHRRMSLPDAIPCPWPDRCQCTHTEGCVAGWLDQDGPAVPCPRCRPRQAEILADETATREVKGMRLRAVDKADQ